MLNVTKVTSVQPTLKYFVFFYTTSLFLFYILLAIFSFIAIIHYNGYNSDQDDNIIIIAKNQKYEDIYWNEISNPIFFTTYFKFDNCQN